MTIPAKAETKRKHVKKEGGGRDHDNGASALGVGDNEHNKWTNQRNNMEVAAVSSTASSTRLVGEEGGNGWSCHFRIDNRQVRAKCQDVNGTKHFIMVSRGEGVGEGGGE